LANNIWSNATDNFKNKVDDLPDDVQSTLTEIANIEGVDVGEKISADKNAVAAKLKSFYTSAIDAIIQGGASTADAQRIANAMVNAVGFDIPEVEMEEKTVTVTGDLPDGWKPAENGVMLGPDGQALEGVKFIEEKGGKYTYEQTYLVPKKNAKWTKTSESVGGSNSDGPGGGGGGGGSSKPAKPVKKTKKSDVVERYKEINDSLDDMSKKLEKASKSVDRLYGADKIKAMKEQNKILQDEIDLWDTKID
jgi:hypothetical protein